ncbi:MAG: redoxin domain-containing protein [Treponema sp.]|jgi:thiol-disulfide isomerase/thioredoxin|nr:redoxin domain-containing protein [Treponema sp.]
MKINLFFKRSVLLVIIIFGFNFVSCAKANKEVKDEKKSVQEVSSEAPVKATESKGPQAIDFSLEMTDGKMFRLFENLDKPILVNYWATWCPPCVREFPDLEEMYAKYKDRMNFIAVNSGENKNTIESFMNKHKYKIPVAMDSSSSVGRMYQISGIPTTFIVATDGSMVYGHVGMMTNAQMTQAIEDALK